MFSTNNFHFCGSMKGTVKYTFMFVYCQPHSLIALLPNWVPCSSLHKPFSCDNNINLESYVVHCSLVLKAKKTKSIYWVYSLWYILNILSIFDTKYLHSEIYIQHTRKNRRHRYYGNKTWRTNYIKPKEQKWFLVGACTVL